MKLDQLETLAQQIDNKMDSSKSIMFETNNSNGGDSSVTGGSDGGATDASQIFNLISQLNEAARQEEDEGVVVNGSGNGDLMDMRDHSDSFDDINSSQKFTEYTVTDAADLSKQLQSASLNESTVARPQSIIPTLAKTTSSGSLLTKIPRISSTNIPKPVTSCLPSPPAASSAAAPKLDGVKQLSSIPVSVAPTMSMAREKTQTISTSQSVSIPSAIPTIASSRAPVASREPRSFSKSNSTYSQSSDTNEAARQQAAAAAATATAATPSAKKVVAKRGASCSTRANNKTTRSMSINPDNEASRETISNDGEPKFNADGSRKYIVRHKPRESQVSKVPVVTNFLQIRPNVPRLVPGQDFQPENGAEKRDFQNRLLGQL